MAKRSRRYQGTPKQARDAVEKMIDAQDLDPIEAIRARKAGVVAAREAIERARYVDDLFTQVDAFTETLTLEGHDRPAISTLLDQKHDALIWMYAVTAGGGVPPELRALVDLIVRNTALGMTHRYALAILVEYALAFGEAIGRMVERGVIEEKMIPYDERKIFPFGDPPVFYAQAGHLSDEHLPGMLGRLAERYPEVDPDTLAAPRRTWIIISYDDANDDTEIKEIDGPDLMANSVTLIPIKGKYPATIEEAKDFVPEGSLTPNP